MWDNMGADRRISHWSLAKLDKETTLASMTNLQQVTLWTSLGESKQIEMFKLVQDSGAILNFWKTLSLKGRSVLVEQIIENEKDDLSAKRTSRLPKLLAGLEMKDKATFLNLLTEEKSLKLLKELNISKEMNEYFFYKNFNQEI